MISALERDRLQRETLRTQGYRQSRSSYDPVSRLSNRHSGLRRDIAAELPGIGKAFSYDKNGELIHRLDNLTGGRKFVYDAAGRITGSTAAPAYSQELKAAFSARTGHGNTPEALFLEESFAYDPASNLLTGTDDDLPLTVFRPTRPSDYGWATFDDPKETRVRHNRLTDYNGLFFEYDGLGRTIEKDDPDHQITRVYRFHCNASGQPEALTDADGNILWHAGMPPGANWSLKAPPSTRPLGLSRTFACKASMMTASQACITTRSGITWILGDS